MGCKEGSSGYKQVGSNLMKEELQKINENFEKQIDSVTELIQFDKQILDLCIQHLNTLNDRLKNGAPKINNPYYLADNTVKALESIEKNKSFTKHYSTIYNQCLVLLVSHFTLSIERIFSEVLKHQYSNDKLSKKAKNQIILNLDEIDEVNQNPNLLKKLLVAKKKLTFQNISNVIKSFENYLGIKIDKDQKLDDIRFAFECRHLIVHSVSKTDEKFIKNCQSIKNRNIKKAVYLNEEVRFTKSELEFVKFSMLLFIQELTEKLAE